MSRLRRTVAAGALLGVLVPTTGCGISLQSTATMGGPDDTYRVTAVFRDAANLPEGGIVQVGQVEIGQVTAIRAEGFRARVDLEIDSSVDLPADTGASLELTSALGDPYVMLDPPQRNGDGGGRTLADTARIPLQRTSRGPDVEDTLAALGTLLNGSGIDQARTVIREVNTALHGREEKVKNILHQLNGVLGKLDRRGEQITTVINSLDRTAATLNRNTPTLKQALTDIEPGLQVLLKERSRFTGLLRNVHALSTNTRGLIDKTGTTLTQQLDELRPVLRNLSTLDEKLGPTLNSMTHFSHALGGIAPGDYLNLDGTIDVPGTVADLLNVDGMGRNGSNAGDRPTEDGRGPGGARGEPLPGGLDRLLGGGVR